MCIYVYVCIYIYIHISYIDMPIYLCFELSPSPHRPMSHPRHSEFAVRHPVDCTGPDVAT